jgi:hypothetical protein
MLRRKYLSAEAFRLPLGIVFTILALLFTGMLMVKIHIHDGVLRQKRKRGRDGSHG